MLTKWAIVLALICAAAAGISATPTPSTRNQYARAAELNIAADGRIADGLQAGVAQVGGGWQGGHGRFRYGKFAHERDRRDELARARRADSKHTSDGKQYGTTYYRKRTKYPTAVVEYLQAEERRRAILSLPDVTCSGRCTEGITATGEALIRVDGSAVLTRRTATSEGTADIQPRMPTLKPEEDVTYKHSNFDGHHDTDLQHRVDQLGVLRDRRRRARTTHVRA
ncbi:hypothetical protein HK405_003995 [Cladochytrium tenue]|nr:hypothetical protein HK405_003995 [Cladochytrium tenue]